MSGVNQMIYWRAQSGHTRIHRLFSSRSPPLLHSPPNPLLSLYTSVWPRRPVKTEKGFLFLDHNIFVTSYNGEWKVSLTQRQWSNAVFMCRVKCCLQQGSGPYCSWFQWPIRFKAARWQSISPGQFLSNYSPVERQCKKKQEKKKKTTTLNPIFFPFSF